MQEFKSSKLFQSKGSDKVASLGLHRLPIISFKDKHCIVNHVYEVSDNKLRNQFELFLVNLAHEEFKRFDERAKDLVDVSNVLIVGVGHKLD